MQWLLLDNATLVEENAVVLLVLNVHLVLFDSPSLIFGQEGGRELVRVGKLANSFVVEVVVVRGLQVLT